MKKEFHTPIVNLLKGSLIGIANIIPGVSGGTIAVVTGIYDRLIEAVGGFFKEGGGWKKNLLFLFPIILGAGLGIILFARVIEYLLSHYPEQTAFLFIGLILGSLPFLVRKATTAPFKPTFLIPLVITLSLIIIMAFSHQSEPFEMEFELTFKSGVIIFFAGVISAAAMIIPGISGSFMLLLFGMYPLFIYAVKEFDIPLLTIMAAGALVGILLVSKVINFLLHRFHGYTYYGIIGLVLGSVVSIYPGFTVSVKGGVSILALAAGAGLASLFGSERPPA